MTLDDGLNDYLQHCLATIEKYGWMIQGVLSEGEHPPFAYTVGLTPLGHPEVIVCGLPQQVAASILNDLGQQLRDGARLSVGLWPLPLLVGFPAVFLEVADSREAEMSVCNRLYGGEDPLPAFQLVFPDAECRWPWDSDSDIYWMPLLGEVSDPLKAELASHPDSTTPPNQRGTE